jgi:hypothetical protein
MVPEERSANISRTCPSLEAWDAWFQYCSVNRCNPDHAAELETFARTRIHVAARKEFHDSSGAVIQGRFEPSDAQSYPCFNFFEIYSRTHPQKALAEDSAITEAKAEKSPHDQAESAVLYKERLKQIRLSPREGDARREVCNYATTFFQPAVREAFRKEAPRGEHVAVSLDAPAPGCDDVTIGELINPKALSTQSPASLSTSPELVDKEGIDKLAKQVVGCWDARERLAMWAKSFRISVDNPVLHRRAACGRDAIWRAQGSAAQKSANLIKSALQESESSGRDRAIEFFSARLLLQLQAWAKSENLRAEDFT